MAALTVWLFDVDRADEVLDTVGQFKERGLVDIFDAALVRWADGGDRPELMPLPDLAGPNRFNESFWSRLFGLTFFPVALGRAVSAAGDAMTDEDLGVTPSMAATLRDEVQPGTAALFIYSSGAFAASGDLSEEIQRTRKGIPTRLLSSNLTGEQDARLQDVFGRS